MDEPAIIPRRRRWSQFGVGTLLLLLTVVALGLALRPTSRLPRPPLIPATIDDVKELIARVQGPKRKVGFINDIRVAAANRLGDIGELARANGAIEALEQLATTTNDPEAQEAAERAVAKLKPKRWWWPWS
jgi:hypothetical protein